MSKRDATHLLHNTGSLAYQFEYTVKQVQDKERRTQLWNLFGEMQEILNQDFEEQFDKEEEQI